METVSYEAFDVRGLTGAAVWTDGVPIPMTDAERAAAAAASLDRIMRVRGGVGGRLVAEGVGRYRWLPDGPKESP